jgi:predicted acetyltransferase
MVAEAKNIGLEYVELTTDPENVASQRTILKCGGKLIEQFIKPVQYGEKPGLRYRITIGA